MVGSVPNMLSHKIMEVLSAQLGPSQSPRVVGIPHLAEDFVALAFDLPERLRGCDKCQRGDEPVLVVEQLPMR